MRTIRNTQIHSVGRMQSFSALKRVVRIETTGLERFNPLKHNLTSRSLFASRKISGTHFVGDWVDPRAIFRLDGLKN
jgi:hypothetical protein